MQRYESGYLFSATDLCSHLECPHLTNLYLRDFDEEIPKDAPDEQAQLVAQKGLEHEQNYLKRLAHDGIVVADLSEASGLYEDRLAAARETMARGSDVIYQALLMAPPFMGYADFLRKVDLPSELGSYSYEVLDTKLAMHPKPYFIVQLCLYSELLARLQDVEPRQMHVVLGDRREVSFNFTDFRYYYRHLKDSFLTHVNERPETYPDPCSHCDLCLFRTVCTTRRLEDDHLSQVANVRKSQIQRLSAVGVTTMAQLADCKHSHVQGIGDETLARLKRQAELQVYKRATNEDKYILLPSVSNTKGLHVLPEPDEGDLFFDIEGDPLYPDRLEYLFGAYYQDNGEERFRDFWAHNHGQEKRVFEELMQFFMDRLAKYPRMHIYHYASYEETALKRLMSRYGTMEAEVDHLLRNSVLVDLYRIVRHSLQISEPSYSIKNLERFYMAGREGEVTTAGVSIIYYEKYRASGDQKYLNDIKKYNLDDCRSLYLLQRWLADLKKSAELTVPTEEEPERESFADTENPHLAKLVEFETVLMNGLPEDPINDTEPQRIRRLLFHLADFYRREAKPSWWRMFSRQLATTEELIEDSECIGGLQLSTTIKPFAVKRSTVYTFDFPEQEYKFKIGDTGLIAETLEYAGVIVDLDDTNRLIQLKRGNKSVPLPEAFDLVPPGPLSTEPLKNSLWDFIDAYIRAMDGNDRAYSAILDLLERRPPKVRGIAAGKPLYDVKGAGLAEFIDLASRLNESYLFIQGPPGTGKTYTASHLIVGLMKAGKKIGVSANSHKVIHNLLDAVEARAGEADFTFAGVKKSSWSSEETAYNGQYIKNVGSTDDVLALLDQVQLVAGTAWLFAAFAGSQDLDYLFIDEAGQVSLANLIAAATAAKNIVLIGDQMQLAQPIQGVHPGESGQSVLDYLLRGRHTIPPEEGILLNTTYRMHPGICRFISDAIYDGRVGSLAGLEKQTIVGNGSIPDNIRDAGLVCHFVESKNSVQRSDEEATHIKTLCDRLLKLKYRDRFGDVYPIDEDNILVVSPYNMQVNSLKRVLGDGARVGTVDKFQGQEAEVVLISMATSSPEDVPRGIDFLYSENRLNVSLSRARILSILVMSPQLLDVRCNTIEQMRLVNTLCWVKEYADGF
jgi:predicted RecB family nuclease